MLIINLMNYTSAKDWCVSTPQAQCNHSLWVTLGWFLNPKFLIFKAAFISLSCSFPQELHFQFLSFNVNSLFIFPQTEHDLLEGSNLPIIDRFLPYYSHLYSRNDLNLNHPISPIALDNLWFFIIFDTPRFSIQIVS